ncbi:response regulator transcription factor [Streptomyces sp. NPDC005805]|uniref:response regulator transcription factor n=1 Tax=Streptomyces sp. NPDC005805 TaxID=3157068 RepID=UPI0033D097E0
MTPIRLLLVDDQPLVRQGLRAVFAPLEDIDVVAEASNGAEALERVAQTAPDVVLMDLNMPRMDGLEATRRICADAGATAGATTEDPAPGPGPGPGPGPKIVMLTMYDRDENVFDALRAGASGFLTKDASPAQLAGAVREVVAGGALLSSSVTRRLIQEFVRRPALPSASHELRSLTGRELDVFRLLVQGYGNVDIAKKLHLGESTIKSHVQHLYRKLGVRDRVQIVIYAYENGLI